MSRSLIRTSIATVACLVSSAALATSDGPDYLKVRDVPKGDVLNMRAEPTPQAPIVGSLAPNLRGVENLGCLEAMDLTHYLNSKKFPDPILRSIKKSDMWCQVKHPQDSRIVGWVNARFVAEDPNPPTTTGNAPLKASSSLDLFSILSPWLIPLKADWNTSSWLVGSPSPIRWKTPGIVMDEDLFHREGSIDGLKVTLFGPRAGPYRVQVRFPDGTDLDTVRSLIPNRFIYDKTGCDQLGYLQRVELPEKKPVWLFVARERVELLPSEERPQADILRKIGVPSMKALSECRA